MSQHSYPSNSRRRVVRYVGAVNRRPDGEGDDGAVSVSSAPTSRVERPLRRLPAPVPQPSPLLKAIVEHICYYRNIASPPVIYPEVAVAFDEFIHRGTLLKKFIERGPPHSRFFCIRFLDLNLPRQDMGPSMNVPEPVLGYYTNEKSRSMRRFFPLVNLVKVSALSDEKMYTLEEFKSVMKEKNNGPFDDAYSVYRHPNIRKRMAEPGVIKIERRGLIQKYIKSECIFVLHFVSQVSPGEEHIACLAPNPTLFLAWLVVLRFFAQLR